MFKIFTAFLLLVSFNLFAQNANEINLEEVVVTGQPKPQSIKAAVQQIRFISKERILKQGAVNLQTVLSNELNMRFTQDAATGGSDITMMGLKGQNVKILIDGLPMVGRQGTSNEININQIDINTIERIEIVEGPMAVIYGADALAGVINIITKKNKAAKLSVNAKIHEESVGSEYGLSNGIHNQAIGINWNYKNWQFGGSVSHNYFGGWKDTAVERELVWHKKDQRMASAFVGFRKEKLNISYRIDGLDEIITNPGNFSAFPNQISGDFVANNQEYISNRVMHQLQSAYNFNNNLNVQIQSSYTNYCRQVYSTLLGKKTNTESLDLAAGKQALINFTGFTFRSMVNYKLSNNISLQPGIDVNTESGKGERLKAGNNSVDDYAFFITSEINPSKKISIKPGIRFIKNSIYKAPPLVGSLNTKFALTKELDLRLSYSNGFRAPSLRELYFNFFDANHRIIGNPNLKAETSNSFTGSINWSKKTKKEMNVSFNLTGFYNNIKNMIDYAISTENPNDFILNNVATSKTAGVTMGTNVKYKRWNLSLGGAYTGFFNDFSETDKTLPTMQWSPEINSSIGYEVSKIGLDINLFYKLNGRKPFYATDANQNVVQATQKDYQIADVTVNKKLFKYITLNTGVRNVFDVTRIGSRISSGGVHISSGLRNIANGRSYFVGISLNIEKK